MHGFKSPNGAWGRDGGATLATVDDSGGFQGVLGSVSVRPFGSAPNVWARFH
jgi:hypothetical protein